MRKLSRIFALLALVALCLGPAAAHARQGAPFKIAILEFDPVTDEAAKENLGRVTAEFLITAAVNTGSFSVVERAALKKVLDEMQFGKGSNAPGSVAQAIGSMVGAQGVLTGSVAKTGGSVRLDARLIDVAGGNIVAARNAYAKADLRSIATAAELLVSQLEGDLNRLSPPAPKAEAKPAPMAEAAKPEQEKAPEKAADKSGDKSGDNPKENQQDKAEAPAAAPPAAQQ